MTPHEEYEYEQYVLVGQVMVTYIYVCSTHILTTSPN